MQLRPRRPSDEHPLRTFLDSWRLFAVLGFAVLIGVLIFTVVTFSRESGDRAARRAAADSTYHQCLTSIPILRKFNRFVRGVKTAHELLLINALAMHSITPKSSPLYKVQERNLVRLRLAVADVQLPPIPVPTKASCLSAFDHAPR